MKITIKDIAREAGVSTSTVSYVINGTGPVSKKKRDLIKGLIDKYNYQPNPIARNLKKGNTRTIGVISNLNKNGPDKAVLEAVARICDQHNYTLLLVAATDNHESSVSFLRDHRVEGIIFIDHKTKVLDFPLPKDFPIVFAYCLHEERASVSVLPDDRQGGYLAGEHLISKGYRKIGLITGNKGWKASEERTDGFMQSLDRAGLDLCGISESCFWDNQISYRASMKILEDSSPEAIFCQSDAIACSLYHAATDSGLLVPGDIGVIGFDNIDFCTLLRPSLSSIAMPLSEIGEKAANLLFHLIGEQRVTLEEIDNSNKPILIPCVLHERDSSPG